MMTFEIGEKVVYPNQGIGMIENISTRSFGNQFEKFYLLRLLYHSITVTVPFSNVTNIGLRKITRLNDAARVLTYLAAPAEPDGRADWKTRFKENTDKMQSGSLLQVAEVMKSLLVLQRDKVLSFREKKMLDRARHMLVTELSIVRHISEMDAASHLQKSLAKTGLNLPAVL